MRTGFGVKMTQSFHVIYLTIHIFKHVYGNSMPNNITVLDMNAEQMTCIEYDTLNQLKNLVKIKFKSGNMSYFPDKDCNNPLHEEDTRPLDLPNLKTMSLVGIKLLKAPNVSLMPQLEIINLRYNMIEEIPGMPFMNNGLLREINLFQNSLQKAPNITGGCNNIDKITFNYNELTTIPEDYFRGCSIRSHAMRANRLTSFPNYDLLSDSLQHVNNNANQISGMITNDMVKNLPHLSSLQLQNNTLQGVDASFCHGNQPVEVNVFKNAVLKIFENPYRFCIHLLDTFSTKPKIDLTSTNIPCDHHRCWMKKYASKFTIQIDDCPDGRVWAAVTEVDVCGEG